MDAFGIRLVALNAETLRKFLLSVAFIVAIMLLRWLLRAVARLFVRGNLEQYRARFWTQQGISLVSAALMVIGLVSIWFEDPARLTTAVGLVTAGLAFALQRVVTAFAGYFLILRGNTFTVGDRITMGGVRGDVIALGFLQTTIMEMGEPPSAQSEGAATWVRSRQFTGRIVTVSNTKVFDDPIYNYTRDFPYLWEEIHIPVTYQSDRKRAEQIILEATKRHVITRHKVDERTQRRLHDRYLIAPLDLDPRIFYRITDNWLELTVRFLVETHGSRKIKDAISREVLEAFDAAKIGIASATYEIVGVPAIELKQTNAATREPPL
ncbi:MAG: mechanosensitive ion channel family protein [Chthoniobacterales bacterium]